MQRELIEIIDRWLELLEPVIDRIAFTNVKTEHIDRLLNLERSMRDLSAKLQKEEIDSLYDKED